MSIDRRQSIIEAAEKSFALFGYKATTMDQVAKIANVGKGTIYTFFANKEQLFQEIMNRLIQEMKHVAENAMRPELQFFDNLGIVLEQLLEFQEQHELALKLSHEVREIGTPMAKEGIEQLERAIVTYLQDKIEYAMSQGQMKKCNPQLTAFVMLKLYTALTIDWKSKYEPLSKLEVASQLRFYLQEGLAAN